MGRYTRYYVNQSGVGEIGPASRASFRVQRGNGIGSFFGGFPFSQTSAIITGKGCRKRSFKTGSNIITDIFNKDPEQSVGNIFLIVLRKRKVNFRKKLKT